MTEYAMNPTDIFINGPRSKRYSRLREIFYSDDRVSNRRLTMYDFQFLLALVGLREEHDGEIPGKSENTDFTTIGRVPYSRNENEFDARFGLVTILTSLDEEYDTVLNHKAFLKNSHGEKYTELPNVSVFYKSLFAGTDKLYDELAEDDISDDESIFDALYNIINDGYLDLSEK